MVTALADEAWEAPGVDDGPITVSDISVVICAFTDARWDQLCASVDSVIAAGCGDVVVVIDYNSGLARRAQEYLVGVAVVENVFPRGLSGARNSGIAACRGRVVAFIDDDAVAAPDWLERLAEAYTTDRVIAVGGYIEPMWRAGEARWFPDEFRWVVGCSYRGMPTVVAPVRNLIGCNMSFRIEVFDHLGGFVSGIGRIGSVPTGCEETELCIRVRRRWPDKEIVYTPAACVAHNVGRSRGTLRYFLARCLAEGRSKALVAASVGTADGLSAERAYARQTLPAGVIEGCRDALAGDPWGLARATAIAGGVAVTAFGYLTARLAARAVKPARAR
jgi:GT2 family glycosyltransferase